MNYISNSVIPHFKVLTFYKQIFPLKKIVREGINIIIKGTSSFPLTVNMLLTDKCNFSCQMCSWKGAAQAHYDARGKELNLAEIESIFGLY